MADLRIGIDTGGTFTDVAVLDRGRLWVHKLPSTPDDPARAVLDGIDAVREGRPVDAVHGTTVGLNAVLTGRLARTVLVTNAGFEDVIEIGRQDRISLYELEPRRAQLPVPRELRVPIGQRRHADGRLEQRPDRSELERLVQTLRDLGAESVAIGLLHSSSHPDDEREIAAALACLGIPITCSAELMPRVGEFERFGAAILNAAIQPVMGGYLGRLGAPVEPGRLRLLRSSGGIMESSEARTFPARAMFSGPAGGVIATARVAAERGESRVAAIDIGGTSTDVSLVSPDPIAEDDDRTISGLPLPLSSFDVHTVGCGGGSIAWVDSGGALRVGPQSAAADPGPAAYGKGDEPTVTDAHVALGHLGADTLLGGRMTIDPDRAVRAIERLAARLGIGALAAARGILEVADTAMMRALLVITSARAVDPARVPLVAYGGAGGLHAATLAQRLSMPYALVPAVPGAFSAVGLALAGESEERVTPILRRLDRTTMHDLRDRARSLVAHARAALPGRGRPTQRVEVRLRHAGQGAGLWLNAGSDLENRFRAHHLERFGFDPGDGAIEVVDLRVELRRPGPRLEVWPLAAPSRQVPPPTLLRSPLGKTRWRLWQRDSLPLGCVIQGPGLIAEQTCLIRIPEGGLAKVETTGVRLTTGLPETRPRKGHTAAGRGRSMR